MSRKVEVRDIFSAVPVVFAETGGDGGARQEFKDECDINRIMRRFKSTGVMPVAGGAPMYGDFSSVESFQDAQNVVLEASRQFAGLSSDVRKRFGNDPVEMLRFVADKANREEAIKLGLIPEPVPAPGPVRVEVINPVVPGVPAGTAK